MASTYNIYCDESCHLEHDHQKSMVLGAVWCPDDQTPLINRHLREMKIEHGLSPYFEIKWIKVSPAKLGFYSDIIDYFFENDDLHYRGVIIPDKSILSHESLKQAHDDWYYKMFYTLLIAVLSPHDSYRVFLDIKDTRSAAKVRKLREVICSSLDDHSRQIVSLIQNVRSHEVSILQLTDLITGAISYHNRGLQLSEAKLYLIRRMQEKSCYSLTRTTPYLENKLNLLRWVPEIIG